MDLTGDECYMSRPVGTWAFYYLSDPLLDNSVGTVLDARIQCLTGGPRTACGFLQIEDGTQISSVALEPGAVMNYRQGTSFPFPTTEPHVYRLELKGSTSRLYIDGSETPVASWGPEPWSDRRISWGLGGGPDQASSAIFDDIRYHRGPLNAPPVVTITGPASGSIAAVGEAVTFDGAFTDAGDAGPHTATWQLGEIVLEGTVAFEGGSGTVTDAFAFLFAGVYPVKLTVTDGEGLSGTAETVGNLPAFVVVYDPSGGFVTGGGWFTSQPGSFTPSPALTGKASFGFVSKYEKGAGVPKGQTEFALKVADLDFHSTSYQWLVCGGARCQFKGAGTVNGDGGYSFLLTAVDGQLPGGGGTDRIRMKIWVTFTGQVVYDSQTGADDSADPTTTIGGGNIVIHKG